MNRSLARFVRIALVASAICICSVLRIPTPIPLTLALFGVFFALFFLGAKDGLLATLLFLALGLLGLPLFSGGGGLSALLSPTGGYLLGFVALALLYLALCRKKQDAKTRLVAAALGLAACYAVGVVWFWLYSDSGLVLALCSGVLPFLLPDLIKLFLAHLLAERLHRALSHH